MQEFRDDAQAGGSGEIGEGLRKIFEAQRANRWSVAATDSKVRVDKLRRWKGAIVDRREEMFAAAAGDLRRSKTETEIIELQPVLLELGHTMRHLRRWMRPRRVSAPWPLFGTRSEIRSEAKGVVLILAPWNVPFSLMSEPLAAAVAAGNCAIVATSEKAPATARFFGSLVRSVFPENEVAVVDGGVEAAKALLDLPFDHIFFTGSPKVGRLVMAAAARNLASVTLELGGKSPAIVDGTGDVREAARRIVWGKFVNTGQLCIAPDYVLVQESAAPEFLTAARRAVEDFFGGTESARRSSADLGRLIDAAAFERLRKLFEGAVERGARIEIGGELAAGERYISPTILTGVAPGDPLMEEEIFGPILPVSTFRNLGEAIELVRARPKPLAMYVFSAGRGQIEEVLRGTSAGGTVVGDTLLHYSNCHLPFGGVGESGFGSYHGEFGFRAFSHERGVLRQGVLGLSRLYRPPYGERKRRIISAITRILS